jgi:hypothetical protein
MADKIPFGYAAGRTVAMLMFDPVQNLYWNYTSHAFAPFAAGTASQFARLMADANGIGFYTADMDGPAALGDFVIAFYDCKGAQFAVGDNVVGLCTVAWDGAHLVQDALHNAYAAGPTGFRNAQYLNPTADNPDLKSYDVVVYNTPAQAQANDGVNGLRRRTSVANAFDGDGNLASSITTTT